MRCQATGLEGRTLECRTPSSDVGDLDHREFGLERAKDTKLCHHAGVKPGNFKTQTAGEASSLHPKLSGTYKAAVCLGRELDLG